MSTKIIPTPGRVVWYQPTEADKVVRNWRDPLACIVAGVIPQIRIVKKTTKVEAEEDGKTVEKDVEFDAEEVTGYVCNLAGFDFLGQPFNRQNVPLRQADEAAPESCYCEWMPYQIGQAQGQARIEGRQESQQGGMSPADVKSNLQTLFANFRGLGQDFAAFKKDVHNAIDDLRRALVVQAKDGEAVAIGGDVPAGKQEAPAPAPAPASGETTTAADENDL